MSLSYLKSFKVEPFSFEVKEFLYHLRYTTVQSLDQLQGHWWDIKDDSAEILFQSFLQEALVSSSGMGRGAILILLHPFPALQDPQQSVSSSLFPTGHGVPPDF